MKAWAPLFTLRPGCRLVLASASPRRRQFLEEWGLPFTLAQPTGAEPRPAPGETPEAYTCRAAAAKATAASQGLAATERGPSLVLAADTVVALEGDILGKPRDRAHALEMLLRLNGREHTVVSAVCLTPPQGTVRVFSDVSRVRFGRWPEAALRAYAHTGEPDDKAGAYAIQGQGAFLVDRVEGSWSTVVGLPLAPLAQALLAMGWMRPADGHGQGA